MSSKNSKEPSSEKLIGLSTSLELEPKFRKKRSNSLNPND